MHCSRRFVPRWSDQSRWLQVSVEDPPSVKRLHGRGGSLLITGCRSAYGTLYGRQNATGQ